MQEDSQNISNEQLINEKDIQIHDLMKIVGHQNKFQVITIFYVCLMVFVLSFELNFIGFAFKSPQFQCPVQQGNLRYSSFFSIINVFFYFCFISCQRTFIK